MAHHFAPLLLVGLCVFQYIQVGWGRTMDQQIGDAMDSSGPSSITDGNMVRVELDMMFTKEDWEQIQRLNRNNKHKLYKRKAVKDITKRWTNNVVPYYMSNDFGYSDRCHINQAIRDWESYTCLDFRKANSGDRNKIYIYSGSGCSSSVGMRGGVQELSLAERCRSKGIIIHELGHAIGFHHEQTRPDRDDHVKILSRNIKSGHEHNFKLYSAAEQNDYGVPYDYTSVMHYGQYYFSSNEEPTIETLVKSQQDVIGNRSGLSFWDIKLANLMYNCGGQCGYKSCPGEGFVGKDCECYCPGSPVKVCGSRSWWGRK